MARQPLKDRLKQGIFLLDGGMGSQLIARQVQAATCNEVLSLESPDVIKAIHTDYLNAGSDAVISNTFGANPISLAKYGLADECCRICEAGARHARSAAGEDRYVLGDIGPCGDFLEPLGLVNPDQLKAAFAESTRGLVQGGVDGIIIETMTALDEITVAVQAVKSVAPELPVLTSMAFDFTPVGPRTIMGVDVSTAVQTLSDLGVDAIGFNCGSATMEQYVELAHEFVEAKRALNAPCLIYAEPNAGRPELEGDQVVYRVTSEDYASSVLKMAVLGIHIFGGCCGTGPEHIGALAARLKK
ncbi:MAG: homocysteine S-methyltransferase family protein [Phycisphaerae bacterium]|nr:homocysteine S-methyltransferase family protein [Phycisphaerae bacterium]